MLLVVVPVHWAMVTDDFGTSLFQPDGPSQFFDAYADSLRRGRLDVHPYHVGNEALIVDDVAYAYQGLTPALLRVPLHALLPELWGRWSRVFLVLAGMLTVVAAHLLVREYRCGFGPPGSRWGWVFHPCFLLAVGLGSTTLFLQARPNLFHEASAVGTALTTLGYACLARSLRSPATWRTLALLVLCFLALHARVVTGAGLVLAVSVVASALLLRLVWSSGPGDAFARRVGVDRMPRTASHAALLAIGVALVAGSYATLNWLKFGSLLSYPLERHVQVDPQRLARTGGRMLRTDYLPSNAYNYLAPWNLRLGAKPLRVHPVPVDELLELPGARYDWREPVAALPAMSPALFLLSGLGLLLFSSRSGRAAQPSPVILLGGAASAFVVLLYFSVTQRYTHDFLPLLLVMAAAGVAALERSSNAWARAWALVLIPATAWSVFAWWGVTDAYRWWGASIRVLPHRAATMIPVYEKALARDPNDALLLVEAGHLLLDQGRFEEALGRAQRALAVDPECAPALVLLARLRGRTDPSEATALLQKAVQVEPYSAPARLFLGRMLLRMGRADEAVRQLEAAQRLQPRDARIQQSLAAARRLIDDSQHPGARD